MADAKVWSTNICPECGGSLQVYQENYKTVYTLGPDGTIEDHSETVAGVLDDDGRLELSCASCGFGWHGYRDVNTGTKFEYLE